MGGKGGRMPNNEIRKMQGMNLASLKHHVALQPLAIIMGGECCSWQRTLVDWLPKPLTSTGPRPRTLGITWVITRPVNSNGSTHLARTTKRLLLIEWPGGRLTTGRSDFWAGQFFLVGFSDQHNKTNI